MTAQQRDSEVRIAAAAKKHFEDLGYEVFPEVPVYIAGQRTADLVCVRHPEGFTNPTIIVVEAKLYLREALIRQCEMWWPHADEVYAAVRMPKNIDSRHEAARKKLDAVRAGIRYVMPNDTVVAEGYAFNGQRNLEPNRDPILTSLTAAQKLGPPAGSPGGKRIFADKWDPVRDALVLGPMTLKMLKIACPDYTKSDWAQFTKIAQRRELRGIGIQPFTSPQVYFPDE